MISAFPATIVGRKGSIGFQNLTDIGVVSPIYTVFRFDAEPSELRIRLCGSEDRPLPPHLRSQYQRLGRPPRQPPLERVLSASRFQSRRWEEQEAIADVPPDVAARTGCYNGRDRSRFPSETRALMQKLLTGEWRVNTNRGDGGGAMKFIYVDESRRRRRAATSLSCAGLMVDAYKLRKKTADFDMMLADFLAKHPGSKHRAQDEQVHQRKGGWSKIAADERKAFLTRHSASWQSPTAGKLFGIGLSFPALNAARAAGHGSSVWRELLARRRPCSPAPSFRRRCRASKTARVWTVVIMDDNKVEMPQLSDGLYDANAWYDGLYQLRGTKRGKKIWLPSQQVGSVRSHHQHGLRDQVAPFLAGGRSPMRSATCIAGTSR